MSVMNTALRELHPLSDLREKDTSSNLTIDHSKFALETRQCCQEVTLQVIGLRSIESEKPVVFEAVVTILS